jgi:hypothetical protein
MSGMRTSLAFLLALLLPACGVASPPTTQANPTPASSASMAPAPASMSTSESQTNPPCVQTQPTAPDVTNTNVTEASDPHFRAPVLILGCPTQDNNTPWQPVAGIPFDSRRTYTEDEQNRVIQSETTIFHAAQRLVTESDGQKRQLDIAHADHRNASQPQPRSEFAAGAQTAPPEPASQGSASSSLSNSFGNSTFGSRYNGSAQYTYVRRANDATLRIVSDARIGTTIFTIARDVVRYLMNAECICDLPSIPTSAPSLRSRSGVGSYFVMGTQLPDLRWGTFPVRLTGHFPELNRRFFGASQRFMVGPVPMMIEAAVTGSTSLNMEMDPQCTSFTLDVEPVADLRVSTSWSVNVRILRAGIRANLSLLTLRMPMHASMGIVMNNNIPCADWRADLQRTATTLNGNIELFTTVRFLFFQEQFSLNIARWEGITLSDRSMARSGQLCPAISN